MLELLPGAGLGGTTSVGPSGILAIGSGYVLNITPTQSSIIPTLSGLNFDYWAELGFVGSGGTLRISESNQFGSSGNFYFYTQIHDFFLGDVIDLADFT